ncbi:MAG: hypothetical protein Q7T96_11780 [Methylobacter sp.]|nr:hypothetical protein [Methylobacter sp.]
MYDECREKLSILENTSGVQLHVATFMIEHCAYWDHPKAGWIQAPKHAQRISNGSYGYQISFGANYFLVSLAISRCVNTISDLIDSWEILGFGYSMQELREKLELHVRGAVANSDGCEYKGYYPIHGNRIIFGTQAIDVKDFVGIVIATSKISQIYED